MNAHLGNPNGRPAPIRVWGQVIAREDNRITLKNEAEDGPCASIVVRVDESTLILDAVTGAERALADLREHELLYAYVSPAMTRSLPPIAGAELVLCGLPSGFAAPAYGEIQSVTAGEDGGLTASTGPDLVLRLSGGTRLLPGPGVEGKPTPGDIKPGARVLAWYGVVTLSLPAQAAPTQVMVFGPRSGSSVPPKE